jgi:hypothetical protein
VAQAAGDGVTAGRRHSAVFDVLDAIRDAIVDADWPTHGDTLGTPDVGYAFDESPDALAAERVQVIDRVEDDAVIEWARLSPAGRDERFMIDVYITTAVPGQTREGCWDRLRELSEVVQGTLYSPTTGALDPPGSVVGWLPIGGVARVTPSMWHDLEGWVAQCIVSVAVATRI